MLTFYGIINNHNSYFMEFNKRIYNFADIKTQEDD